LAAMFPF